MGYTTEFTGKITVTPPLNKKEIDFLTKFSGTRRMNRSKGPYYVASGGDFGQAHEADIIDYNTPPEGQPGLWCHWVPTEGGTAIEWDGGEKFYEADAWMIYLIQHFLCDGGMARIKGFVHHTLNGVILAQGEDSDDTWSLVVVDNKVSRQQGHSQPAQARVTVRLPRVLHRSIQAEAIRLGLSLNAYLHACLEAEAARPVPVFLEVEATVRFKVSSSASSEDIKNYLHQAVSQWRGQCKSTDPMSTLDYRSVEVVKLHSLGDLKL